MNEFVRAAVLALAIALLSGCTEDSGQVDFPPADQATAAEEESSAAEAVESPAPTTVETIEATAHGLVGDGKTLNTEVLRLLFAQGDRTIHIAAGDYLTGSFTIGPRTVLVLDPGTIIRDSGQLEEMERLINVTNDDVRITGFGARVIADRARYKSGEWRHGVFINGAHNVVIEGLESSGHGGDGFYIGGSPSQPSVNITLNGCTASNNRRQGLSITNARLVYVRDGEFTDTQGTAPEFGIDLEPNLPTDVLDHISLLRPHTARNRGGGIMIQVDKLDASSEPIDIVVIDHASEGESPPLRTKATNRVAGEIFYNRG